VKTFTFFISSDLVTSLGGDMHSHERLLIKNCARKTRSKDV